MSLLGLISQIDFDMDVLKIEGTVVAKNQSGQVIFQKRIRLTGKDQFIPFISHYTNRRWSSLLPMIQEKDNPEIYTIEVSDFKTLVNRY